MTYSGRGKTGSGKTLAFSIPDGQQKAGGMRRVPLRPTGLVLAPTRELASQITATLEPLAAANGLRVTTIFGGVPQGKQVSALKSGIDIVVACPGRLEDLIKQKLIHLDAIEITVIDEADHMADLGFLPGVTRILAATPSTGQRLLFSATMDNDVDKLVNRFMTDPVMHSVDSANSPVSQMTHHVFHVPDAQAKKDVVHRLASGTGRRILFIRTKASRPQARQTAHRIRCSGGGSARQSFAARTRQKPRCLQQWRCTCAGGDRYRHAACIVDGIELVVHIDPPAEHKAYLHRSGRTARPGNAGDVAAVVLPTQRRDTAALMRRAGIRVTPQEVTVDSAAVHAVAGEAAPYQAPAPKVAAPQRPSRPRSGAFKSWARSAPQPFGTPSSILTLRASSAAWCYGCPG